MNEVIYDHGYGIEGNFIYSLYVDGELIGSKKMTFIYQFSESFQRSSLGLPFINSPAKNPWKPISDLLIDFRRHSELNDQSR